MAKTFEIIYQAKGAASGAVVTVDVFKPDKTKDVVQSGAATEIGTTGRYYKSFDADAPGWFCEIADDSGGKAVKHFDKGRWDRHGIADTVATIAGDVTALGSQLNTVEGKIDGLGAPAQVG